MYEIFPKAKDIPAAVGSCLNISSEDAQVLYGILTRMMVSFGSAD